MSNSENRNWLVLVQTYGGAVSVLKHLTRYEAEACERRLIPRYANGSMRSLHDGEITGVEIIPPAEEADAYDRERYPWKYRTADERAHA